VCRIFDVAGSASTVSAIVLLPHGLLGSLVVIFVILGRAQDDLGMSAG
jgi:hypothetical protein